MAADATSVVTIGEPPGGEEACDTSSSSDGDGSDWSDEGGYGSADNALNRPVEADTAAGLRHRVVIEASKGPVRWFEVPLASFTVGRGKENQVSLGGDDFSHVSRTHLKVEYRAGRMWITDLNSSKGTSIVTGPGADRSGDAMFIPAGKAHGIADGTKVNLGGCVDLAFRVERKEAAVGRRAQRKEKKGGAADFVSNLQHAVFRRKITEVGTVSTIARQRRERGPRPHARNDEFGRRIADKRSRSRSRSRSRGHERPRSGGRVSRSRSRSRSRGRRSPRGAGGGAGGRGRERLSRSRSNSRSSRGGRAAAGRKMSRSRSRSRSRGRHDSLRRGSGAGGSGRLRMNRSKSRSRDRKGRGPVRAKEGVDADRWQHRPLSLSPSPPCRDR